MASQINRKKYGESHKWKMTTTLYSVLLIGGPHRERSSNSDLGSDLTVSRLRTSPRRQVGFRSQGQVFMKLCTLLKVLGPPLRSAGVGLREGGNCPTPKSVV